jgi:hypothetical protein
VSGSSQGIPFISRWTEDGELDTSFGTNGITAINAAYSANNGGHSIAVASDGSIYVSGVFTDKLKAVVYYAVARLKPDGMLESAWGSAGIIKWLSDGKGNTGPEQNGRYCSLALDPQERVVVFKQTASELPEMEVVRLCP